MWASEGASKGRLTLRPDLDNLPALAIEREALWASLEKTSFLSTDEKRALAGFSPLPADQKFNPGQLRIPAGNPDGGQWTNDGGGGGSDLIHPAQARRGPPKQPSTPSSPKPGPNPTVPPGTTIRNKDLAGRKHPDTGIPFDKDGFPDFSSVATHAAEVPHTGNRAADFRAANKAAGFGDTPHPPAGMTWHHHQDGRTMQLVPADVHRRTGHTGSIGVGNTPGRK